MWTKKSHKNVVYVLVVVVVVQQQQQLIACLCECRHECGQVC